MSFNINSFIDCLNMDSDRRLLYNSTAHSTDDLQSYNHCPLAKGCKTTFSSLDSFFRACISAERRTKTVGHSKTCRKIERPDFCKKCNQLETSKKSKLVIDLAEYGIEIDEGLIDEYMEERK